MGVSLGMMAIGGIFGCLVLSTFVSLWVFLVGTVFIWYAGFQHVYERLCAIACDLFCAWTFPFFRRWTRIRGYQYGDDFLPLQGGEKSVIMCNHQSWCDVPLAGAYLFFNKLMGETLWVAWDGLKNFPFAWAARMRGDVFIPCQWEKDEPILQRSVSHFLRSSNYKLYFIFPEGGLKTRSALRASQKKTKELGLEPLNQLLWPRHKALSLILDRLRTNTNARYVYDITVRYRRSDYKTRRHNETSEQHERRILRLPSLLDLFLRQSSDFEIHGYARRFRIFDLPRDPVLLKLWLQKVYREKEQLLDFFDKNGTFPAELGSDQLSVPKEIDYRENYSIAMTVLFLLISFVFWSIVFHFYF